MPPGSLDSAPTSLITPRQAAVLLGVSESTVRRWCDSHQLATARTTGRHRRIHRGDLLAFARAQGLWRAAEEAPSASGRGGRLAPTAALAERLHAALLALDRDGVSTFVHEWFSLGGEPEVLFDGVLAPAMRALGAQWEEGGLAIFQEHRATQLVLAALGLAHAFLPPVPGSAPIAICAALAGDPYAIAPQMAALVVQAEGYRPLLLGPDTPAEEVVRAARATRASLLVISIGAANDPEQLAAGLTCLTDFAAEGHAALAIGGRALGASAAAAARGRARINLVGETMGDLRRFARARAGSTAERDT